ncbi:U-box domain-containing protein 15 [Cannabis sativa]|uniref:RING-type E3 ubiquitin transferase n=2 Tax=Cannabis sativa TaxID=3483 RepID=A0AB40ED37_CANSA|nr:U-box domain-containing protein 15 [Cannabis sativa]KAF4357672.1 hypothetical protein F8388_007208 [Cannabis sativa]KAF4368307.1 hypothetical protein G4B88_008611 [Cannabis sativa]KAF4382793.1 hypothetical protein G4B88_021576 [Cannabis sativa]
MEEGEQKRRNVVIRSSDGSGGDENDVVVELMGLIETVGSYSGYRKTTRKQCLSLVRRLQLLVPLLEEIRENDTTLISAQALNGLVNLKTALLPAKKLLKDCNYGSKIYLALESEAVMGRFHAVYDKLNQALDEMPYDELGISVEVKEQVELMHTQLQRARRRTDTQDMELAMDLMVVFSKKKDDRNADSAILERLATKLELHTVADLKEETFAVKKLLKRRRQNSESLQQMTDLLNKFKAIAGIDEALLVDSPFSKTLQRCPTSLIPHEFLCPITLEIMIDPVIVASGQTYERASIEKWLFSNRRSCPKTGQTLDHLSLAPNFALKNVIRQWCEQNKVELPRKDPVILPPFGCSAEIIEEISSLVQDLYSCNLDVRREAIVKIRMLSKENPENRILIASSGGIPPLVQLLSYPDSEIQEQTVTALLNLSIDEANKRLISREGAIPAIIEVLQKGNGQAKENSAAALFSLSMIDENKLLVGNLNGIPPLVELLGSGTIRGKKDAATALFNLSLNQANKSRVIKAGIIPPLLHLLEDKNLGMVDEALSILQLLASHPEGRSEIGRLSFIETLVRIIQTGTPKNKECATSVLLELGLNNSSFILGALQYGVYESLVELSKSGTNRAQRKANSLLQHMSKCEHIP